MPWKDDFFRSLNSADPRGDRTRVRLNVERGAVVDFVVQYETPKSELSHDHFPVVRYDGSHQRVHRDLLDRRGETIRKTWLPDYLTFNEALQLAIADIDQNWRRYRRNFFRRKT